jgi:serine/threonine-protein kinase
MRLRGPYATLLAGVVLATVVGVLDVRTDSGEQPAVTSPSPSSSTGVAQPTGSATPTQSESESASAEDVPARANYAGRTKGGKATVAIAVRDGRAIAYVCDGVRAEAWLLGNVADGALNLTSDAGDRLIARLGDGQATGRVVLGKQRWAFRVPTVQRPNGLYRANATVGGVRFRGGWIVLPDGQTGVANGSGDPGPAPPLDPNAGTVTIDGTQVPVAAVSGITGAWL